MCDSMLGEWKLETSVNFEEIMKELGVGFMLRKLGANTKPNVKLEKNGDNWTFSTISAIKTIIITFKLNEEFDEETADGRKVKTTFTVNGDKLIQTQKDPKTNQVVCVITREITNNELKATIVAGKVEAVRTYSRL